MNCKNFRSPVTMSLCTLVGLAALLATPAKSVAGTLSVGFTTSYTEWRTTTYGGTLSSTTGGGTGTGGGTNAVTVGFGDYGLPLITDVGGTLPQYTSPARDMYDTAFATNTSSNGIQPTSATYTSSFVGDGPPASLKVTYTAWAIGVTAYNDVRVNDGTGDPASGGDPYTTSTDSYGYYHISQTGYEYENVTWTKTHSNPDIYTMTSTMKKRKLIAKGFGYEHSACWVSVSL